MTRPVVLSSSLLQCHRGPPPALPARCCPVRPSQTPWPGLVQPGQGPPPPHYTSPNSHLSWLDQVRQTWTSELASVIVSPYCPPSWLCYPAFQPKPEILISPSPAITAPRYVSGRLRYQSVHQRRTRDTTVHSVSPGEVRTPSHTPPLQQHLHHHHLPHLHYHLHHLQGGERTRAGWELSQIKPQ